MHEVSLVQALFDQTDRAIAAHPRASVRTLKVRIGELAGVEIDAFRTAFDGCRNERGYAAAELEVVDERAEWKCTACEVPVPRGAVLLCESCGAEVRLVRGGELFLDRVELEVSDV